MKPDHIFTPTRFIAALFAAACLFHSCKDKHSQATPALDLSSQIYTDPNGVVAGTSGNVSDEFAAETFDTWLRNLFAPLDTMALPASPLPQGTQASVYPNPAMLYQAFSVHAQTQDSINLKIVLVNRNRELIKRAGITFSNGQGVLAFDYSTVDLKGDSLFRMYFALSTKSNPYYFTSHADVTIKR